MHLPVSVPRNCRRRRCLVFLLAAACCCCLPFAAAEDTVAEGAATIETKWDLWNATRTVLRGANVWSVQVIKRLDGLLYKGPGPVGPPYAQDNLDRLASLGANHVVLSCQGLFNVYGPTYKVWQGAQSYLDRMVQMVGNADMFATISVRAGPGRADYSVCCQGDKQFKPYLNDIIWSNQKARNAYVKMWKYMASRYRNNPVVVGYQLMVEPNQNDLGKVRMWNPKKFHERFGGTTYDWNTLYPEIVRAIREVDPETPILISGTGYGGVEWLPYLEVLEGVRNVVYVVHQYAPHGYTHQGKKERREYPGRVDVDDDGQLETFNYNWMDSFVKTVDDFQSERLDPAVAAVAVQEFGVVRHAPGADKFIRDEMSIFEGRGWNHAIWNWQTDWYYHTKWDKNEFDFMLGPDPNNKVEMPSNALKSAIQANWAQNIVRPSNVPWTQDGKGTSPCRYDGEVCGLPAGGSCCSTHGKCKKVGDQRFCLSPYDGSGPRRCIRAGSRCKSKKARKRKCCGKSTCMSVGGKSYCLPVVLRSA